MRSSSFQQFYKVYDGIAQIDSFVLNCIYLYKGANERDEGPAPIIETSCDTDEGSTQNEYFTLKHYNIEREFFSFEKKVKK